MKEKLPATVHFLRKNLRRLRIFSMKGRDDIQRRGIRSLLERTSFDISSVADPFDSRTKTYRKPKKTDRKGLITYRVGQGYYR